MAAPTGREGLLRTLAPSATGLRLSCWQCINKTLTRQQALFSPFVFLVIGFAFWYNRFAADLQGGGLLGGDVSFNL